MTFLAVTLDSFGADALRRTDEFLKSYTGTIIKMKKFYLCKLCVIVFGALLAVQSAVAGNWNSSSGELKINSGKKKEVSKFRDYSLISDTRVVRAGSSSQRF